MCVPRDATLAWLSWELITSCEDDRAGRPELWTGGPTTVGWDVARRRNYSVQWAAERVGDVYWTREIVEMVNRPFREQEDNFGRLLERYKAYRAAIDQTGMGERSVELMQDFWGKSRVEGVLFSRAGVKQDLAQMGRQMFEDRRVRIPPSRLVRDSHHALRKTVTSAGNIRFEADDNAEIGHGDHAWAHFLTLHAADGHTGGPVGYQAASRGRFNQRGAF
jgi:phage FluMu gp28-like protein